MKTDLGDDFKQRKIYYDIIRLVAIFLVVFNHTPAFHFPFHSTGENMLTIAMLFISALDKVAVPLFFMISGALLLSRQESVCDVLCKRVLRFVCVIVLFYLLQTVYYSVVFGEQGIGIRNFISFCYKGKGYASLATGAAAEWFLYAYLGFLLMLPFLRKLVSAMPDSLFHYLFFLQFVCYALAPSAFVTITGFSHLDASLTKYLPLCSNVFVYILAGYYIEHRVDISKVNSKRIGQMLLASVFVVFLATVMPEIARMRMNATYVNQYIPGLTAFMLLPCISIVLIMKKLCAMVSISSRAVFCLQHLGGAVFTVMLIENILRKEISAYFPDYNVAYLPSVWVTGLVWLCGILIGLVLKRIPLIRKLV